MKVIECRSLILTTCRYQTDVAFFQNIPRRVQVRCYFNFREKIVVNEKQISWIFRITESEIGTNEDIKICEDVLAEDFDLVNGGWFTIPHHQINSSFESYLNNATSMTLISKESLITINCEKTNNISE